jgi:hypothetical protein
VPFVVGDYLCESGAWISPSARFPELQRLLRGDLRPDTYQFGFVLSFVGDVTAARGCAVSDIILVPVLPVVKVKFLAKMRNIELTTIDHQGRETIIHMEDYEAAEFLQQFVQAFDRFGNVKGAAL